MLISLLLIMLYKKYKIVGDMFFKRKIIKDYQYNICNAMCLGHNCPEHVKIICNRIYSESYNPSKNNSIVYIFDVYRLIIKNAN